MVQTYTGDGTENSTSSTRMGSRVTDRTSGNTGTKRGPSTCFSLSVGAKSQWLTAHRPRWLAHRPDKREGGVHGQDNKTKEVTDPKKECLESVHKSWRTKNEVIITPASEENTTPALLLVSEPSRY